MPQYTLVPCITSTLYCREYTMHRPLPSFRSHLTVTHSQDVGRGFFKQWLEGFEVKRVEVTDALCLGMPRVFGSELNTDATGTKTVVVTLLRFGTRMTSGFDNQLTKVDVSNSLDIVSWELLIEVSKSWSKLQITNVHENAGTWRTIF